MRHGARACACANNVKLLRRDKPNFITAPSMWLLNTSDFSPVDYRILAMLQKWVCQHPVRHVDKLWQRLTDRQRRSLIKRLIGGDFIIIIIKFISDKIRLHYKNRLRASVVARGKHLEHLTLSNVLLLHCIVGPLCFHTSCDISFN